MLDGAPPFLLGLGWWSVNVATPGPAMASLDDVERARADSVSADHELLSLVDTHLLPRTRSQPYFVPAVASFGHEPFKGLLFDGLDEH